MQQEPFSSKIVADLQNIFQDDFAREVFNRSQLGMQRNYSGITDGTRKSLTIIPPVYGFNSRIGTHDVMNQELLQEVNYFVLLS